MIFAISGRVKFRVPTLNVDKIQLLFHSLFGKDIKHLIFDYMDDRWKICSCKFVKV